MLLKIVFLIAVCVVAVNSKPASQKSEEREWMEMEGHFGKNTIHGAGSGKTEGWKHLSTRQTAYSSSSDEDQLMRKNSGNQETVESSSSEENPKDYSEIIRVRKQFHDTDPEVAGNGRRVSNSMRSRSHKMKMADETKDYEGGMLNTIYKDM